MQNWPASRPQYPGVGPPFQSQYPGVGLPLKRAIPRIEQRYDPKPAAGRKPRGQTCTNCRKRKVKCTGEAPRCKLCGATDTPCIYDPTRNDRLKTATEVLDKLISRLKYLRSRVDNDDKKMINDDLAEVEDKIPGSTKPPEQRAREESTSSEEDEIVPTPGSTKPPGKRARKNSTPSEDEIVPTPNSIKASGKRARKDSSFSEDVVADPKASRKRARKDLTSSEDVVADLKALVAANAPASVGSNGSMDLLDKDLPLNRTSGETSFVGQNSEVNILMSGEAHVQDDIADPLAEDEADIDRRPSLLAYPGATLALQSGNVVPMPGPSLSTYPGPTLSLGYENVFAMPDPNLSPGQFQFPITYDDSFLTNFDQQSSIPLTMDESWRNAGGDSLQYSQGQQYQPQSHYYQS